MFGAFGRTVYRFRRAVVIGSLLVALLAGVSAADLTPRLSAGGWNDTASQSAEVDRLLASSPGAGAGQLFVLFEGPPGTDARGDAFQTAVGESLAPLLADPLVARATGYAELADDRFISLDGSAALVVIDLAAVTEEAIDDVPRLRALIGPIEGVGIGVTGVAALVHDAGVGSERDLVRAETISLPLVLVILVAVFGSLVAGAMPLLVAGLAIPTTLGLVALLAQRTEMSLFVLNVATMLGLALAIDYSLFVVSRYREELARGHAPGAAVERALATAGKAVAFSALAVAIGLSGLLLFKAAALTSIGVAGVIVVAASAIYSLTFLPALLGMLGPRVDALSVKGPLRTLPLTRRLPGAAAEGRPSPRWLRLAHRVMAHPVAVLVPTFILLVVLGIPFLQVRQAVPDAAVYPRGMESRDAFMMLQERFSPGQTSPIIVLAEVAGDPTGVANLRELARYAEALDEVPGVVRVESYFNDLPNPLTGEPLTIEQVAAAYQEPALRGMLAPLLDRYVRGSLVRIDANSSYLASDPQAGTLVTDLRGLEMGGGMTAIVGGTHAAGQDLMASLDERVGFVVMTVLGGMFVVLFLLFGSVVIPIKAIVMTLLSMVASFGALVWIFQLGNLEDVLAFEAPGYTVAGIPIVMFAVLFGLSMDYEVLLLSRIRESYERSGDNTAAVADGLARTAGVITGAALIMVVVFASFATAEVITIKALGVGMAIAILLDATVVRVLLVPATMRLLGERCWWAPGPLRRVAERVGFSHVELVER
jgi:RND superfamily putative drug exporter